MTLAEASDLLNKRYLVSCQAIREVVTMMMATAILMEIPTTRMTMDRDITTLMTTEMVTMIDRMYIHVYIVWIRVLTF